MMVGMMVPQMICRSKSPRVLDTAKCTTGWVIYAAGGPVSWASRRAAAWLVRAYHTCMEEYIAGA
jgi:hypothetical protein